ncbi:MAG: DedA family protein [Candidatus Doudnabacteria bacterium]
MWFNLNDIIQWLIHYKYLVIFPFAVFEGPIITIIAGFLASMGQLNFWVAFMVVAAGDLFADNLYYFIGYYGRLRFISKFEKYLGMSPARVELLEKHFEKHPWKTFIFGKIAHGTGSLILAAAGLGRVPYWEFIGYNIPTSLVNSFILIVIGFYFGHAYAYINTFFGYSSLVFVALLAGAYIYFIYRSKKYL